MEFRPEWLCSGRELALYEPFRLLQLPNEGWNHFAIGLYGARIWFGCIGKHYLVKLRQSVIWNHRKHVMLDVVIHVPIKKAKNGIHIYGSRVEPVIENILR
jgi:hypothetical protein